MPDISVDSLLEPVSPDAPCGDNLEYQDPLFGEMERAAEGKPEQQFGDSVTPAEEPDWRAVRSKALELLGRTKDIRVAVYLARAALGSEDLSSFRDSLALLGALVDRYWDAVHPQLDPEDDLDPTIRVNTLATLCDHEATLNSLQRTPIVRSRGLGKFSMRDIAVASGELPQPDDESPLETATIDAAFQDADLDELQADADAVREALDHVTTLENSVTDRVGVGNSVSFEPLARALKETQQVLVNQLARRGVVEGADAGAGEDGVEGEDNGAAAGGAFRVSGDIGSREDAIRMLDKVCDYFDRHEPSSPLPMLIRRAQRLANKSFIEIIRDLAPDVTSQAESLGGIDSSSETD